MAGLLGDPSVMRHYPRPKTRMEALDWIRWNERNYAEHGFGLWIIETHDGEFVGDCGLTYQPLHGRQVLEVGYHVTPAMQGSRYATEAARACADLALCTLEHDHLVAIMKPDNIPSRRVAARIGMRFEQEAVVHDQEVVVFGRSAG